MYVEANYRIGGTNYKGQIIFAGEGQGEDVPSALYLMNPEKPYNTTSKGPLSYRIEMMLLWLILSTQFL